MVSGIVIILFFQCMDKLLNPVHRRMEGIRWGLVAHTVAMFSAVTVYTAMSLNILSDCYIDNREFPGVDGVLPPGPSGYRFLIYSGVISLVPNVMFLLNNWLADGLLVSLVANSSGCQTQTAPPALSLLRYIRQEPLGHRLPVPDIPRIFWYAPCQPAVSFSSNGIDAATGLVLAYQTTKPSNLWYSFKANLGLPYFSISVSLNVLLTLIIVARLVLHSRSIRHAMGPLARPSRLYNDIVTILIESSAIYAIASLLLIGLWATKSRAIGIFLPILAETQVRTIFPSPKVAPRLFLDGRLIVMANRSSLRSSLFYESPTRARRRATLSSPVRFVLPVKGTRRVAVGPFPVCIR